MFDAARGFDTDPYAYDAFQPLGPMPPVKPATRLYVSVDRDVAKPMSPTGPYDFRA